ncbi:MAG: head GIN domain-containing protein [Ginsengibacter sp.]
MKKMSILIAASVLICSCHVINGPGVTGNGNIRTEKRNAGNFNAVKTAGSIDVEITTGDTYSVSVEDDDNILQYVVTDVHNGVLTVDYKDGYSINEDHAKVYVTAPSLDKLSVSGSADITAQGVLKNSRQIEMNVSGSGNIKAQVDAPAIDVSVSGSGNIDLTGHTKDFTGDIAGSGDINCGGLESENVTVKIAGSGNAHVFASVHLSASIVGSGDVYYRGNPPSPEVHTTGSGTVEAEK